MKLYKVSFLLSEEQVSKLGGDPLTNIHDFVDKEFGDTAFVGMATLENEKDFSIADQLSILNR